MSTTVQGFPQTKKLIDIWVLNAPNTDNIESPAFYYIIIIVIIIIKGKSAETEAQFVWSDIFIFFFHVNIPGLH